MEMLKKMTGNPYVLVGGGFVLGALASYMVFKPKTSTPPAPQPTP
jgi:hypothetical protein